MANVNKVLYNVDQRTDTTAAERKTARDNIGAPTIQTVTDDRPAVITEATDISYRISNRKLSFGNDVGGMLVPEPVYGEDGYILQASWVGGGSGVWTNTRWVPMPTFTDNCEIILYSGTPQVSEDDMGRISTATDNNRMVFVLYGNSGASYIYGLVKRDSTGYTFAYNNGETRNVMFIAANRDVTITRLPPSAPTTYWLGNSIWQDNVTMKGQSSGAHIRDMIQSVDNTVTLYSGHKYLIQPSCAGTAEYTTARSYDGTARFNMELLLTKDDYDITYGNYIVLGTAQFYFNGDKGSNTAGYHFNVGINPVTTVITPSSTLALSKCVLMNSGNVLGTDDSHTAKMFLDYQLGTLIVQEIP